MNSVLLLMEAVANDLTNGLDDIKEILRLYLCYRFLLSVGYEDYLEIEND